MHKDYYIQYYTLEREHWYFLARNHVILTYIRGLVGKLTNLSILNVGVATGRTSELLEEFGSVTSIEYDQECYMFTKERLPDLNLVQGSILDLDFDNGQFDLVCAFDVIEHVKDDRKAVQEMQRVCRGGGHVVVTVPAFMTLWSHHDEVNMHERRYTMSTLSTLFDKTLVKYRTFFNSWLFLPIAAYRILSRLKNNLLGGKTHPKDRVGSDFKITGKSRLVDQVLQGVFSSESYFVRKDIRLPFGVSILLCQEIK